MKRAATLLLLLAGCGGTAKPAIPIQDLLASDAKAEAFRIVPPAPPAPPAGDFLAWKEVAGPVPVPPSTARALAALLMDPASYQDASKPCVPIPGVKLRYTRGAERGEILFCFECLMLFTYRNGAVAGQADFDPGARPFARLLKPLFPQDPAIQALRE